MRIIAGEFKGRTLAAPKGIATRPTTDRVRESLMSAIGSARGGFDDAVVLDAFAGSGALGLEALSRGAASVHFYEINASALRTLSANVAALQVLPAVAIVHRCDVLKAPPTRQQQPFDLVFLDPPYALETKSVRGLIAALDAAAALADDALICYEHDKAYAIDLDSDDGSAVFSSHFDIISHKVYGDTAIDILRKEPIS
ncbi:MAG: 16S rRNA (guanine(966)-N(2))-methyltransferase RsmD [Raoultibacter sp.]